MNNTLEFLNINKTKKKINFPLLDMAIKTIKKYNINEYKINNDKLRFMSNRSSCIVITYNELSDEYNIELEGFSIPNCNINHTSDSVKSDKFIKKLNTQLLKSKESNDIWNRILDEAK